MASPRGGDKLTAILDAAEVVFAKHGYHNAQMARVAQEAGVATGTIYLYVKNKSDLLICLFRDRLAMIVSEARACCAQSDDPVEQLRLFVANHFRLMARSPEMAMVTQIEMRQADTSVQQQIAVLMKTWFDVIDEIVERGQAAGRFRPLHAKQIRNMVFGTLDQTVTAWVLSGFKFDLEALTEPTFALLAGGCCTGIEGGGNRHGDPGASEADV
jgi:TetR/AcrR family fatty acid metabolism transcriptional regulator